MAMALKGQTQLQRLHIATAVVFTGLAVAAGVFMKAASYPLVIAHATRDELASQSTTVFAPAIHHIIDIDMRVAVIVLLGLGIITALLASSYWRKPYEKQLATRQSPLTWLSLGAILPALMVEIVAMLNGVQDVFFLKALAGLTIVAGILCYLAERQNRGGRQPKWLHFWLAFTVAAVAWFMLAVMYIATPVYGMVRLPGFVYGLFAVLTVASLAAFVNLWYELKGKGWAKDFNIVERNYLVINLLAKGSFALLLIIGLKK